MISKPERDDLDQLAEVMWFLAPPQGDFAASQNRSFPRLEEAIWFVMTEVPEDLRESAWITVKGAPPLPIDEIRTLFINFR